MSDLHSDASVRRARIVIIGGGFSGIGMAVRLRQQGITDFVILERASAIGGTWRDNSYPGCACDVQSVLYSFSFAPNPDWSRTYSQQPEIWAYLQRCVRDFDVGRHIVFDANVTSAAWDDDAQQWTVTTTEQRWLADVVVMASGPLSDPVMPSIDGLELFAGTTFHSSRWDHACDLRGKRVAVIGTGASAIQFVPKIQPVVGRLDLFQRTPPWVLPRKDKAIPEWRRALYRTIPLVQRAERAMVYAGREALHFPFRHMSAAGIVEWEAKRHLRRQISDPALRARLVPSYRIGCKRILVSDDYYPSLQQPNVSVVTDAITSIVPAGVVTADGLTHAADVIILGTGFRATDPPLASVVVGRDGRSLADAWRGSPQAYMGTSHVGFPNFFFLLGPNTALGHSSVMLMVEAQIDHALSVLQLMEARGAGAVEPDADAQRRYVAAIDVRLAATTWNSGGCRSWYLDVTGRNSTLWPDGVGAFRRTVATAQSDDYHFTARHRSAPTVTAAL